MNTLKFVAILTLVCFSTKLLTGCTAPIRGAKPGVLAFLNEGETTREDVTTTLGQPSGSYEQKRILTYRVGYDQELGYFTGEDPRSFTVWGFPHCSLVLLFDDNGFLRKQSLVDIHQ